MDNRAVELALAISGLAVPLAAIGLSAAISGGLDLIGGALSDLGNRLSSPAAPIFNCGLCLGGILIGTAGARAVSRASARLAHVAVAMGAALSLVGLVDESYGPLHFAVASLFFALLEAFVALCPVPRAWRALAIAATVLAWSLHFSLGIPRGVAVPELVSVIAASPFYVIAAIKGSAA